MEFGFASPYVAAFVCGIALVFCQSSVCISLVCMIKPHLLGTAVALVNASENLLLAAILPLSGMMVDYVGTQIPLMNQTPDTAVSLSFFGPMNLFGSMSILALFFSILAMLADVGCRRAQSMHLLMNPSVETIRRCRKDVLSWGQYHIEIPVAEVEAQAAGLSDMASQLFRSVTTSSSTGGLLDDGEEPRSDLEHLLPPAKSIETTSASVLDLLFIRCGLAPDTILTR
jgi:hypothetical protein